MIILEQLSKGYIINNAMRVGIFNNLLDPITQHELSACYPTGGFVRAERLSRPGKLYSFSMLPLVNKGQRVHQHHTLHFHWENLIALLLTEQYSKNLSSVLDIDLTNTDTHIGFYRFMPNDYAEVHTDHENKIVTQIFYFNTSWCVANGGFLQLLHEKDSGSCFLSFPPLSMYSIAIVRNDFAWHAVTPISKNSSQERLSLQLEYYKR